jgi:hypothetical protein
MARKPRTKKAMVEYLENHFRYYTGNSWNRSTSYAANVKLHRIMSDDLDGYDFLQTEEAFREGKDIIRQFEERHKYEWQIFSNGRSSGYLVLYTGGMKPSGYKRYCHNCGQLNYRRNVPAKPEDLTDAEWACYVYVLDKDHWVPDIYPTQSEIVKLGLSVERVVEIVRRAKKDVEKNGKVGSNKCGRCNAEGTLHDFTKTHMQTFTYPYKGVDDDGEDFESWDIDSLRWRVNVVWDFDKTVERVVKAFIDFVKNHKVVEKQIMVPKTVQVAVPKGEEDGE